MGFRRPRAPIRVWWLSTAGMLLQDPRPSKVHRSHWLAIQVIYQVQQCCSIRSKRRLKCRQDGVVQRDHTVLVVESMRKLHFHSQQTCLRTITAAPLAPLLSLLLERTPHRLSQYHQPSVLCRCCILHLNSKPMVFNMYLQTMEVIQLMLQQSTPYAWYSNSNDHFKRRIDCQGYGLESQLGLFHHSTSEEASLIVSFLEIRKPCTDQSEYIIRFQLI